MAGYLGNSREFFSETISSHLYGDKISRKLHLMQRGGVACDLEIIVNENHFNVHRNVVMAASNYLERYFSRDGGAYINLDMLTSEGVSACIDFMYSGEVQLTSSNVTSILQAADLLEMYDLINMCLQVLRRHLSIRTCALTSRLFHLYGSEAEKSAVDAFMAWALHQFRTLRSQLELREVDEHIMERFMKKKTFNNERDKFTLTHWGKFEQMERSLSSSTSNPVESQKWEVLVAWLDQDSSNVSHLLDLVKLLDFKKIPAGYILKNIRNHAFVRQSRECREILNRQASFCTAPQTVVMLDADTGLLETIDMSTDHGHHSNIALFQKGAVLKVVSVDGQLYVLENKTLRKFTKVGDWQIVAEHPAKPCSASKMIAFSNDIYLVESDKMSCCSPDSGIWTEGLPGCELGSEFCLAVNENFMYAIGGSKARRYSPTSRFWTKILPPNRGKSAATATYYDDKIYLLGGYSKLSYLDDVETYDIKKNKWRVETGMNKPCGYHATIEHNETLIVAGGFPNGNIVQIFDKETGIWTTREMEKKERILLAVCTL